MLKYTLTATTFMLTVFIVFSLSNAQLQPQFSTASLVVKQGEVKSFSFDFYNNGNSTIKPLSVVTMPLGADWITPQYTLPNELNPGEKINVTLVIDASYLNQEEYDSKLIINYKEGNITKQSSMSLKIYVQKGTFSFVKPNISISIPSSVDTNHSFDVIIDGYGRNTQVFIDIKPQHFSLDNIEITGTRYKATYRFSRSGIYTVSVKVYENGALAKSDVEQVSVGGITKKHVIVKYEILRGSAVVTSSPKAGDVLKVEKVWCNETEENLNTYVYVNGVPHVVPFEMVLSSGKKYVLWAGLPGYVPFNKTIEVAKSRLSVSYTQGPYEEGKKFEIISVRDENGKNVSNYEIYVNGRKINGKEFVLSSGNYSVVVKAPGFYDWVLNFTSAKRLRINYNGVVHPGDKVTIRLPRSISWRIKFNGNTIASGSSNVIDFIPENPGLYFIYSGNEEIGKINVVKEQLFKPEYLYLAAIVVAIGIVVFVGYKKGLFKKKAKVSWEIPYTEGTSYPIEEGE